MPHNRKSTAVREFVSRSRERRLGRLTKRVAEDASRPLSTSQRGFPFEKLEQEIEERRRAGRRNELAELRPPEDQGIPFGEDIPLSTPQAGLGEPTVPLEGLLGTGGGFPEGGGGESPAAIDVRQEQPLSDPETAPIEEGGGRITFKDIVASDEDSVTLAEGKSATLLPSGEIIMDGKTFGPDEFGVGPSRLFPAKAKFSEGSPFSEAEFGKLDAAETVVAEAAIRAARDLEIAKNRQLAQLGRAAIQTRNQAGNQTRDGRQLKKAAKKLARQFGTFGGDRQQQADRARAQREAAKMDAQGNQLIEAGRNLFEQIRPLATDHVEQLTQDFGREQKDLFRVAELQIMKRREQTTTDPGTTLAAQDRISRFKLSRLEARTKGAVSEVLEERDEDFDINIDPEDPTRIFILNKETGVQLSEQEFLTAGLTLEKTRFGRQRTVTQDKARLKTRSRLLGELVRNQVKIAEERQKLENIQIMIIGDGDVPEEFRALAQTDDIITEWLAFVREDMTKNNRTAPEAVSTIRSRLGQ